MADPAAIRELRRQRILQSGRNRMDRVLGKPQNDDPIPSGSYDTSVQDERSNLDEQNDALGSQKVIEESQKTSLSESTVRKRPVTAISNDDSVTTNEQTIQNRSTVKISPIKRTQPSANSNNVQNDSLNSSRISSDAKMMLKHFEFLRIVMCVMVAYLCRRVLSSGYGVFYIESVILPFACLESSFFLFKHKVLHNVILPHKSSMLIGILMLCGIKPVVVQTYNKVMGYFTAAMEDFALFFFAFMMANTFIA
ncbi:hypothetical protein ACF0H5_001120 [Mactra antiquata]